MTHFDLTLQRQRGIEIYLSALLLEFPVQAFQDLYNSLNSLTPTTFNNSFTCCHDVWNFPISLSTTETPSVRVAQVMDFKEAGSLKEFFGVDLLNLNPANNRDLIKCLLWFKEFSNLEQSGVYHFLVCDENIYKRIILVCVLFLLFTNNFTLFSLNIFYSDFFLFFSLV